MIINDNCPVIGIDLDEVCADFVGGFNRRAYDILGPTVIRTDKDYRWPCWEITDALNITPEQEHDVWNDIMQRGAFWGHLPILPGVRKSLRILQELEAKGVARLVFITARPEVAGNLTYRETVNWLRQVAFVNDPYVIIAHDKGAVARAVGLTHFIDDKFQNCVEVLYARPTAQVSFVRTLHGERHLPTIGAIGIDVVDNLAHFTERFVAGLDQRQLA